MFAKFLDEVLENKKGSWQQWLGNCKHNLFSKEQIFTAWERIKVVQQARKATSTAIGQAWLIAASIEYYGLNGHAVNLKKAIDFLGEVKKLNLPNCNTEIFLETICDFNESTNFYNALILAKAAIRMGYNWQMSAAQMFLAETAMVDLAILRIREEQATQLVPEFGIASTFLQQNLTLERVNIALAKENVELKEKNQQLEQQMGLLLAQQQQKTMSNLRQVSMFKQLRAPSNINPSQTLVTLAQAACFLDNERP